MADELTTSTNEEYKNQTGGSGLLRDKYQAFVADNTGKINQMYDASKESQLANLEMAYNQNLSDAEANRAKLAKEFNAAANDLGIQYERNRYNNNIQAAQSGLNVGVGSQMQLAQTGQYQRDFGALRGQQASQESELDRQIANINMTYRSEVNKAIADNDFARAAALVDEANNQVAQLKDAYQIQYGEDSTAAALLASSGDYSGYANLLGLNNDQQGRLAAQWIANNPDAAYQSGMIDPNKYFSITGKWPVGYSPYSGGGGGRGSIKGTYYDSKVLGSSVTDAAKSGDPAKVEAAYNNYVKQYGQPTAATKNAWARQGLTIG